MGFAYTLHIHAMFGMLPRHIWHALAFMACSYPGLCCDVFSGSVPSIYISLKKRIYTKDKREM
jgi:hypothetical protein